MSDPVKITLAALVAYPATRRLLEALNPNGSQPTAIHRVAQNVEAAMHCAAARFPHFTQAAVYIEQLADARTDPALTHASRAGVGINLMDGHITTHPEWSFWAIDGLASLPGAELVLASVILLVARGDAPPAGDLHAMRRAFEESLERGQPIVTSKMAGVPSAHGAAFDRAVLKLDKRISEVGHLANDASAWAGQESADHPFAVDLGLSSDAAVVEAPTLGKANRLAQTIGLALRRQFCRSATWALSGDQARAVATCLRVRAVSKVASAADSLALFCLSTGRPVGQIATGAELGDVHPGMACVREGGMSVDLDRGLVAFRVVGGEEFWDEPDHEALRACFITAHHNVVLPLPPQLLAVLKERVGARLVGLVYEPDDGKLAGEFAELMAALSKELGWRVSATRLARALPFAIFAQSNDLPMAQRLSGDTLGLGAAGQHYLSLPMGWQSQLYADSLARLGVLTTAGDLPLLPPDWLTVHCGARRRPTDDALKLVATVLNHVGKRLYKMDGATRLHASTTPLAVTAAVLLMLGSSHRWTAAIGRLTLGDLHLASGLAVFMDKASTGSRLAGLPPLVVSALAQWLGYLTWAERDAAPALAQRARAALDGSAPLLFCCTPAGDCSDLELADIARLLGPAATEALKGARCVLSSTLREEGIAAPVVEAMLGRLHFGLQPFDAANLLNPASFYAPAMQATDGRLRGLGFRAITGMPDRAGIRFEPGPPPAPWSAAIMELQLALDREASADAVAFEAEVRGLLPALTVRATALIADSASSIGDRLDRPAVRRFFDTLRTDLPRTPPVVVACARALQVALKPLERRGIDVAPLAYYTPRFAAPCLVTRGQMRAVASHEQLQRWLLRPTSWPEHTAVQEVDGQRRIARLALCLLHFGLVRSLPDARAVILALPQAQRWPCLPDSLVVAVNWASDKDGAIAASVVLGGALTYLAAGLRGIDTSSMDVLALEAWCESVLASAPWPTAPLPAMLAGIIQAAGLAGSVMLPGPLAAIARGELTSRELPPDLLRAVLEGTAPEPARYPAPAAAKTAVAPRCEASEAQAKPKTSFLRGLNRELKVAIALDQPSHVRDWARGAASCDAQMLLGEVAARLVWLPGQRVASYAVNSQVTFLSLVAGPLLARLGQAKLATTPVPALEAAFLGVWEAGDLDPRRALGLTLASEVLGDLYGVEDLDLDELQAVVGQRPVRALVISPVMWKDRASRLDALCDAHPEAETRAALGDMAVGLELQYHLAFRTDALAGVRAADTSVCSGEVGVRATAYGQHTVKTAAGDHRCFIPSRTLGGGWMTQWKQDGPAFKTLADSRMFGVAAGLDRNDLFRTLAADPRLRPHDLRSTRAVAFLADALFDIPAAGGVALKVPTGTMSLWELTGELGQSHPRVACQSYLHVFCLWRSLRLGAAADAFTMPAIAGLLGWKQLRAEEVRRSAGGGKRKHGSLGAFRGAVLRKLEIKLAPVPGMPEPPGLCVASRDGGFPQRWQALRALHAGAVPLAAARANGMTLAAVTRLGREVLRLEHAAGLRVLPDAVAAEMFTPHELAARLPAPAQYLAYSDNHLRPRSPRDRDERELWLALLRAHRGRIGSLRSLGQADVLALLDTSGPISASAWRIRIPTLSDKSAPMPPSVLAVVTQAACAGASIVAERPSRRIRPSPRFGADLVRAAGVPSARIFASWLVLCLAAQFPSDLSRNQPEKGNLK